MLFIAEIAIKNGVIKITHSAIVEQLPIYQEGLDTLVTSINMAKKSHFEEQLDYEAQMKNNEFAFKQMLRSVRPELFVLVDLLDETKINPMILFKTMRQLNNIALGSKYGTVTVYIENGIATFVRGEESDKLNEKVVLD